MKKISRKQVNNFWSKRAQIKDARISTHFKQDDTHLYDLDLIKKYATSKSNVLDVACGTCFLTNQLADNVAYIKGTDKFGEFLEHCQVSKKFEVQQADILTYQDKRKYDLILMFGIITYFDDDDTALIYKRYKKLLTKGGVLIVKHQCGLENDVLIDKFSEQIGDKYQANYKHVNKDLSILKKHFANVELIDIYPSRLNVWENTHFFAFVCKNSD